jgi:hypothetical protein
MSRAAFLLDLTGCARSTPPPTINPLSFPLLSTGPWTIASMCVSNKFSSLFSLIDLIFSSPPPRVEQQQAAPTTLVPVVPLEITLVLLPETMAVLPQEIMVLLLEIMAVLLPVGLLPVVLLPVVLLLAVLLLAVLEQAIT